jgi:hypothetical protein
MPPWLLGPAATVVGPFSGLLGGTPPAVPLPSVHRSAPDSYEQLSVARANQGSTAAWPAPGAWAQTSVLGGQPRPRMSGLVAQRVPGAPSVFDAVEVDARRFALVAAPIGSGARSQLNIYEQVKDTRPCFAVGEKVGAAAASVNPLLSTFDFSGICKRYVDSNGYSVRIGNEDLGGRASLRVVRTADDVRLVATIFGEEELIARAHGPGAGFVNLELEPGWRLMRRHYGEQPIGHMYLMRDASPSG